GAADPSGSRPAFSAATWPGGRARRRSPPSSGRPDAVLRHLDALDALEAEEQLDAVGGGGGRGLLENRSQGLLHVLAEKDALDRHLGEVDLDPLIGREHRLTPAAVPPSPAAGAPRPPRAPRDQSAAEGRRPPAVLLERPLKTHHRPVAPGKPPTVDRQVVDQARIEGVRRVTAVPGYARRGLLRQTQQRLEGADVLGQDRFVAEVAGDFGEAREEFVHAHRRLGESGPLVEITRQLDLHRELLLPRLYAQQRAQSSRGPGT